MSYRITIFDSIGDVSTENTIDVDSFDEIACVLTMLSKDRVQKPGTGISGVPYAKLISPARYEAGSKRLNANVIEWAGWCAIDVDDYDRPFKDIMADISNYRYICYSTASSTKEHPKFRLLFDLTDPVPAKKIRHFWYALNKELMDISDIQTKDLSRMFYTPGQYPNAFNFMFENEGEKICPATLMMKHPYVDTISDITDNLSEPMKKKLAQYRSSALQNNQYNWTSYRDCPFVNPRLVEEYMAITDTGWYHKMYTIMVSIAGLAINKGYSISADEIVTLCKEIDNDNGGWYHSRPLRVEAERALNYVLLKGVSYGKR